MTDDTWENLEGFFAKHPIARAESVSEQEVDLASETVQRQFPPDYREFLLRYGGAAVGSYPILGLRQVEVVGDDEWDVVEVNEHYRAEEWPGADQWLIVSVDLGGNPVGIAEDGAVWVWDHDYRGAVQIARDFEDFLRRECLKLPS